MTIPYGTDGSSGESVNVGSQSEFERNNELIESALNRCCSDVADMLANIQAGRGMTPGINQKLAQLKTVRVDPIDTGDDLNDRIDAIVSFMNTKSVQIVAGINYAELSLKALNEGKPIPPEAVKLFNSIMQEVTDTNVFWLVNELLAGTPYKGIGFLLSYGTDAQYEGGSFVVGDAAKALFNLGTNTFVGADFVPSVWMNAGVGSIVVAGASMLFSKATDQGDWTSKDTQRMLTNAGIGAASYFEWTMIAGAIGGVPGVIVAGVVAIPSMMLLGGIRDRIVGDNTIDSFVRQNENGEWVEYEVPRNGNGKNGTYDVILEQYGKCSEKHYINNKPYSETSYKNMLYNNWEELVKLDTGCEVDDLFLYYSDEQRNQMNQFFDKLSTYDDPDAAFDYYSNYLREDPDGMRIEPIVQFLVNNYDFTAGDLARYRA